MATVVISAVPGVWQRRTRAAGRAVTTGLIVTLHLVLAAMVLTVRISYAVLGMLARTVATAELRLSVLTGRTPLGQTAGVALTTALAAEFRTAYHQPTR